MKIRKVEFAISGMTCDHCAQTIQENVSRLDGILSQNVRYSQKRGVFEYNAEKISEHDIARAINAIGPYKVQRERDVSEHLAEKFDLIIIGGGSAAFAAALRASELEKKVLMLNAGLPIGGTCVNVGCVPSKTLIRNAEQFYRTNHPDFSSIKPADNVMDFKEAIRQKADLVENLRTHKYLDVLKANARVTLLRAFGKLIDQNTVEADGKNYVAEKILIASGSSTFVPQIPGLQEADYLTNETLYRLTELPEHLLIMGGRYMALENAQMFARLGARVTVLQRSERIFPTEMPDVSEALAGYLKAEGVEIKTGVRIRSVFRKKAQIGLHLSVGSQEETLYGSHLFLATGRKGNTSGMGLEKLNIQLHGNGFIKTDPYNRTTVPNILAAGDVTGEHLFVYTAAYAGVLAVDNAFSEKLYEKDYAVLPWVVFTDPQLAGVGLDEAGAAQAGMEYEVSKISLKDVPRSLAAHNTRGFVKLIRNTDTDQLIGARIVASEGSELLMEIALAIKYGITVAELKRMFHPYLTLAEAVKLAAINFDKDIRELSCCAV